MADATIWRQMALVCEKNACFQRELDNDALSTPEFAQTLVPESLTSARATGPMRIL
jgi:hypothetical protein